MSAADERWADRIRAANAALIAHVFPDSANTEWRTLRDGTELVFHCRTSHNLVNVYDIVYRASGLRLSYLEGPDDNGRFRVGFLRRSVLRIAAREAMCRSDTWVLVGAMVLLALQLHSLVAHFP